MSGNDSIDTHLSINSDDDGHGDGIRELFNDFEKRNTTLLNNIRCWKKKTEIHNGIDHFRDHASKTDRFFLEMYLYKYSPETSATNDFARQAVERAIDATSFRQNDRLSLRRVHEVFDFLSDFYHKQPDQHKEICDYIKAWETTSMSIQRMYAHADRDDPKLGFDG